jgi:hypothetical protein
MARNSDTQKAGFHLAEYLNRPHFEDDDDAETIKELLNDLQVYNALSHGKWPLPFKRPEPHSGIRAKRIFEKHKSDYEEKVDERLQRLKFFLYPASWSVPRKSECMRFRWEWNFESDSVWTDPAAAGRAFRCLFFVAEEGKIDRVKVCARAECGRWFYAVKPSKIFCGDRCREKLYRSSEDGRKHRAEYMRNYRKDIAKRDARALATARKLEAR